MLQLLTQTQKKTSCCRGCSMAADSCRKTAAHGSEPITMHLHSIQDKLVSKQGAGRNTQCLLTQT